MKLHLSKFLDSKTGKYITSMLLGFGLATFFREVCKGENCNVFYAPPLTEVENKIFKHDNKCYKYNLVSIKCSKDKKNVMFAS
jgi:hypothetical protein